MKTFRNTERHWEHLLCNEKAVDGQTGLLCTKKHAQCNYAPIYLRAGTKIIPKNRGIRYRVFRYEAEPDGRWSSEYDYAPEGNWLPFAKNQDLSPYKGETVADRTAYYRFVLENGRRHRSLEDTFVFAPAPGREVPGWIGEEAGRLVKRMEDAALPKGMFFALLTDTHYCVGGNWQDTFRSINEVSKRCPLDGIIHLGDLTDGLSPADQTKSFANGVIGDLESTGLPVFLCLGNHDENYFRSNPEPMSKRECSAFYLKRNMPYYAKDFPEHRLKILFLDSFHQSRKERYGFDLRELQWVRHQLNTLNPAWHVLICSHVTPVARLHVWSKRILRGEQMIKTLSRHNEKILGWIHGHSHADQVFLGKPFPIIGIGCGKQESFQVLKPAGSVTYSRKRNDPTQELWDVLFIPDSGSELRLFRYGAGTDRRLVKTGEKIWQDES